MNEIISQIYHAAALLGLGTTVGLGLSLSAISPVAAQQPPHQFERSLTLDAANLNHFHSRLGDGQLRITGHDDIDEIEVRALIFYYDEGDIVLSLENLNGEARLEGGFVGGSYSGNAPYMDVEIRLPVSFSADIRHGDGRVEVKDLNEMVTIESGVGDIDVQSVGGVRIQHRSGGKVSTRQINGPVRISQRS